MVNTQIESWFFLFSLIFGLSVYFYYLSRITFGGRGDAPLPLPPGPTAAAAVAQGGAYSLDISIPIGYSNRYEFI